MKIVFALIWIYSNGYGGAPLKVGEYEKHSQCKAQAEFIRNAPGWTGYSGSNFLCVPVNATGSR